jgi:hypothetical protein
MSCPRIEPSIAIISGYAESAERRGSAYVRKAGRLLAVWPSRRIGWVKCGIPTAKERAVVYNGTRRCRCGGCLFANIRGIPGN